MTTKIIVAIVAAVGLGFAGTYFATGSGGSCSDGGCPISRMLGLGHGTSADVTAPACPACCGTKAKVDCCDPPQDCCAGGGSACCGNSKHAISVTIVEPTGSGLPTEEK